MADRSRNWFHRLNHRIASSKPGAWMLSHSMHYIDRAILRLTKGKKTLATVLTGIPGIKLTTIGAKSGLPRSVPLNGFPDGDRYVLIASNWGRTTYPAWYHNLKANPQVIVTVDGQDRPHMAHEAIDDDRERLWQLAVGYYAGYELYKQRAGGRPIPVIVLTPVNDR